jgi:transcriptional regulator with XRE-family HTH domain
MNKGDFAAYLKRKREYKGYTVNQLAMYSKVSAAQISRIENRLRGVPKHDTLEKLAGALNIPFSEMLDAAGYIVNEGKENDKAPHQNKLYDVIARAQDLPEENIDQVADALEALINHHKDKLKKSRGE